MLVASWAWFNSVAHATLLLAGATVVLAIISAFGAGVGRRAAEAATQAAEAAESEAKASAESLDVARDTLARSHRPVLTEIPLRKYSLYGLANDALKVVPGPGSATICKVPLRNVGTGTAVIEHEDSSPAVQVRMNPQWYRGAVDALVVPVGEAIMLEATTAVVPVADPNTRQAPTLYVRVAYKDLAGNRFTTYLCLMRDDESADSWEHAEGWSVHGVALDDGGRLTQAGDGWDGFTP